MSTVVEIAEGSPVKTLSLEECREILGEKAVGLTDDEVGEIRDHFYWLADICIDMVCEDVQLEQGKSADEIPLRLV